MSTAFRCVVLLMVTDSSFVIRKAFHVSIYISVKIFYLVCYFLLYSLHSLACLCFLCISPPIQILFHIGCLSGQVRDNYNCWIIIVYFSSNSFIFYFYQTFTLKSHFEVRSSKKSIKVGSFLKASLKRNVSR